ncbi:homoserine O-acetyltransferase [Leptothrix cholodnii SP-6]|uniref:Homoserine O-acetyltransferase n=2 Tax=Leptothrix cholodnii TaxID=34029 RepID=B1Y5X9_LEPCP|nr:homoserine O-acetyltransferase [Leptothrix cholodnii SP-6]
MGATNMHRSCLERLAGAVQALVAALLIGICAAATAHWPDQPPHQMARLGEFKFERGGSIPDLRISYVTHGKLNAAKDNAVLFLHGFGGNHHNLDAFIGPGRAFDTDKYFVICPDALGATQTGYAHSSSPTSTGLKMKFPKYNQRDMVEAQHRLVTKVFGIPRLLAVTGISSGGAYAVQYAVSHPQAMAGIIPISGGTFFGAYGRFEGQLTRSILDTCAGWQHGNYRRNPAACATNALSVLIPRFYTPEWWDKYVDTPEAYQRWRVAFGAYYLDVQDARDLYYLNDSFDRGWLGDTPGFNGDVAAAQASIKARALFVHPVQDAFFPQPNIANEVAAIAGARAASIDSLAGHTIWYNADPQATAAMTTAIRAFLAELHAPGSRVAAER